MFLLKPCGHVRRLTLGLQMVINVLTEGRIAQRPFDLIPRDRLQDHPGILREVPQNWIECAPNSVSGVVPRPAHIQSKLSQGVEPFYFRGQKAVYRVADTGSFAHDFSLGTGTAANASPTIVWASSRMRRK
jgi:hypothetical protein